MTTDDTHDELRPDRGTDVSAVPVADPFTATDSGGGGFMEYIPPFFRRGSEFWRWVSMVFFNAGTISAIGLLVVGTGLVGSGLAILLNGFDVVDVPLTTDLGTSLAIGLVVGLIGAFAIGLAVEGPIGYKLRRFEAQPWEVALTAIPPFFIAAWLAARLADVAERLVEDLPAGFAVIAAQLDAVAAAAIKWPLIVGVATLFVVHQVVVPRYPKLEYQAHGLIYVVWLLAAVAEYSLFS